MSAFWFKHFDGMVDDAKWDVVAEIADAPIELVSFTFAKLCEYASKAAERGSIAGFDPRLVAARLRRPRELIERIIAGLREIGVIVGDSLRAWVSRQGQNAAAASQAAPAACKASTLRSRRLRERRRQGSAQMAFDLGVAGVAPPVAGVAPPVAPPLHATPSPRPPSEEPESESPPLYPPHERGGSPAFGRKGSDLTSSPRPLQGEILLPLNGDRDGRKRRETAWERRQRLGWEANRQFLLDRGVDPEPFLARWAR
ncbi:MAG TPA: hypothetical protein VGR91_19785 [Stellaceae bacterium]|nr:hypothetical protein [Stellaceae bacterium]